jgi:zinc transport system ATP-binding protein
MRPVTKANTASTDDVGACLRFERVWFHYDSKPAVENVTFSIGLGDFAAILGPNGSGKTTLIKLALGLEKPTRGTVTLLDQRPDRFRGWDQVGYVPQTVSGVEAQFPATVQEIVAQGLYRGFDPLAVLRPNNQAELGQALETTGIADLRSRRVSSLSVGQQQRTLIARALVRNPRLLVLDEPVAGVDAAGQEQIYEMLSRLNKDTGITILIISHDIGAVLREATTVACINRTLVFHGPPHRLTQKEISELYGLPMDVLLHDVLHEHR